MTSNTLMKPIGRRKKVLNNKNAWQQQLLVLPLKTNEWLDSHVSQTGERLI